MWDCEFDLLGLFNLKKLYAWNDEGGTQKVGWSSSGFSWTPGDELEAAFNYAVLLLWNVDVDMAVEHLIISYLYDYRFSLTFL